MARVTGPDAPPSPPEGSPSPPASRASFWAAIRARHPHFWTALMEDARMSAGQRGERNQFRSGRDAAIQIGRLALVSDAFLAQACYRAKARLQSLGVPLVPRMLHRLAMISAQV